MQTKRLLCAALSFCTAVSMLTAFLPERKAHPDISAAAYEDFALQKDGIFTYFIEDGKVTIEKCDADAVEAVIPDTIAGLPVTFLTQYAFSECSELTSVTLPETIGEMGRGTFADCPKLTEIHFPPTLTNINRYPFESCPWWEEQRKAGEYIIVNGVLLAPSKESSGTLVIPEGVTKIGAGAFQSNKHLKEVTLPEGLTEIGVGAFMHCDDLQDVTFPSTLTTVGQDAFRFTPWLAAQQEKDPCVIANGILIDGTALTGDVTLPDTVNSIAGHALEGSKLTSITVPNTVTSIGESAFGACRNLQSVKLPEHLTAIPEYCFASCTSLTSVNLPEGITVIPDMAFSNCQSLMEIRLPPALKSIGWEAFSSCTSLKTLELPDSVEIIKGRAFSYCEALTSVTIPEGVRQMDTVFNNCTSLHSVRIPASVTSMERALSGCEALETINIDEKNTVYKAVDNVLFSKDGSRLILYPQKKPDTAYTVPDSVTMIDDNAFMNAMNLISVTLPEHMEKIGGSAFWGCTALKQITIPEGVKLLGWTFNGCHALESVTLPKSLAEVYSSTFVCDALKEIWFNGSVQDWGKIHIENGNQALYRANVHFAEEDDAEHQQYTLYKAPDALPVPEEHQSYQIKTESKDAAFAVIAGNAAEVSKTGLVKPTKNYGETIIRITDGKKESFLHVTTEDYAPVYANARIIAFLNENITADMTDLEKLEVIGKLPASMDYNADHWDYIEMLAYNTGNCAGSATMLAEMCRRLGIKAWVRNANRDPGARSSHVNALAEADGAYYELEAGFEGKAPRSYKVTKRTSLCKFKDAADGLDVYQYDGIDESETVLVIPESIDGKTVTRIGDGFLTENPWVRAVTIPDTVTEISESAFPSYDGVLFGAKGSVAEQFAAAHGIRFGVTGSLEQGDVNSDLVVDIMDVIAMNKHILGIQKLSAVGSEQADMNGNGLIEADDSLLILKKVLGILD